MPEYLRILIAFLILSAFVYGPVAAIGAALLIGLQWFLSAYLQRLS